MVVQNLTKTVVNNSDDIPSEEEQKDNTQLSGKVGQLKSSLTRLTGACAKVIHVFSGK